MALPCMRGGRRPRQHVILDVRPPAATSCAARVTDAGVRGYADVSQDHLPCLLLSPGWGAVGTGHFSAHC